MDKINTPNAEDTTEHDDFSPAALEARLAGLINLKEIFDVADEFRNAARAAREVRK